MKILLNGATGGTNFGDFLFAEIFQDAAASLVGIENVFWYDSRYSMSSFYKKHLKYDRSYKLSEIDALICISGGYFCGDDHTLKNYIIRYLMYFHLCMQCIRRNIPIAIIGVEVGKPKLKLMEWIERYILRKAKLLIVRNQESLAQLHRYGITNGICTADTAHTIGTTLLKAESLEKVEQEENKKLFFHVQMSSVSAAKKLIPALNRFLSKHPEYAVFVGTDQFVSNDTVLEQIASKIQCEHKSILHYDYPVDLCNTLAEMDFIITPKLHVGIVGATLDKSVLSFSVHSEKIERFYHQIGEAERSLPMAIFAEEKAVQMMEKYHALPIKVPESIVEQAQLNLQYLKSFINGLE